jgi:thymidylate synthase (FAD)
MGYVIIQEFTTKIPIQMIGLEAGVCWGADTTEPAKNYQRGIDCLESNHGRTFEYPDVYMILGGYSARVIREWYTHIGGSPTRLQASTRYINYQRGFKYVTPPSIKNNKAAKEEYEATMEAIMSGLYKLEELGIPKEDSAMLLPLGMETKIVCKHNARNLIDMSHPRTCTRAYHEYRQLFNDVSNELRDYSPEWKYIVDNYFMPKCKYTGFCTEKNSCGLMPKKQK